MTITAVFDRGIERGLGSIGLLCDGALLTESLPAENIMIDDLGHRLIVSLSGRTNSAESVCELSIEEAAIVDMEGVEFQGTERGEYRFTLYWEDVTPPALVEVSPLNGAALVTMPVVAEVTFDEAVTLAPTCAMSPCLSLSRPEVEGAQARAFYLAATPGTQRLQAVVDGRTLRVYLLDNCDPETLYSLTLVAGVVVDANGNPFFGVREGDYVFRTAQAVDGADEVDDDESVMPYVLGCVAAALAAGISVMACLAVRLLRERQQRLAETLSWDQSKGVVLSPRSKAHIEADVVVVRRASTHVPIEPPALDGEKRRASVGGRASVGARSSVRGHGHGNRQSISRPTAHEDVGKPLQPAW